MAEDSGNPHIGYILELYWGFVGIMEKKMETTIMGLGFRAYFQVYNL